MGLITDRTKPNKKGKFAPWILKVSGPVALASVLMYANWFQGMPMGFKIFWMFFSYILWGSICYTGINIPYGSMASAISEQPKDRIALSNWRTIGATLASTTIGVILPLFVYYKDDVGNSVFSGSAMSIAAIVCSISAVICYMLCYFMCTERVRVEAKTEKFSLKSLLSELAHNKALIGIVISALLLLVAQLSLQGMGAYIYSNYFGDIKGLSIATLISSGVTLALATLIVKIADKVGKKEIAVVGAIISGTSLVVAFILHTHSLTVWLVMYSLVCVGISMFNLVIWAMITDIIDNTEIDTGKRSDGIIYSVYSFARKMGQAASSGITGVLLSIIGYTTVTAFDTKVVDGIYNITCIVPAVGFFLLAAAMFFLYPLNKKMVQNNARILQERRNAN
jgi:GPH family glycoside/pentoside/hexuronide:cation symporter